MIHKHVDYYLKHLKHDAPASIVVFLVALPLCLGIAMASGAPLAAGLIAGIVGGLIVSWASGSQLSVSGPAAGLTVIVFAAIETLGSFEALTNPQVYVVTITLAIIASLATDLLQGIIIGIVVGVIFVIRANYHSSIIMFNDEENYTIQFNMDYIKAAPDDNISVEKIMFCDIKRKNNV